MTSNCKKCQSGAVKANHAYRYHDVHTCQSCGHTWEERIDDCCREPDPVVAMDGDGFPGSKLYHQCRNCGGAIKSKPLKWKTYSEQIRGLFCQSSFKDWKSTRSKEQCMIYESIRELNHKLSDYYKYETYLQSPEWKAIRNRVLERDNHTCQSCKTAPATDVHHLTYERLYNEPLTDLQSLCRPCHERVHGKERKNPPCAAT